MTLIHNSVYIMVRSVKIMGWVQLKNRVSADPSRKNAASQ